MYFCLELSGQYKYIKSEPLYPHVILLLLTCVTKQKWREDILPCPGAVTFAFARVKALGRPICLLLSSLLLYSCNLILKYFRMYRNPPRVICFHFAKRRNNFWTYSASVFNFQAENETLIISKAYNERLVIIELIDYTKIYFFVQNDEFWFSRPLVRTAIRLVKTFFYFWCPANQLLLFIHSPKIKHTMK